MKTTTIEDLKQWDRAITNVASVLDKKIPFWYLHLNIAMLTAFNHDILTQLCGSFNNDRAKEIKKLLGIPNYSRYDNNYSGLLINNSQQLQLWAHQVSTRILNNEKEINEYQNNIKIKIGQAYLKANQPIN